MKNYNHNELPDCETLVLKYDVPADMPEIWKLELPVGSTVLSAAHQWSDERTDEAIVIYAEVHLKEKRTETHSIFLMETAEPLDDLPLYRRFIGTVTLYQGQHVRHVYHYKG